MNIVNWNCGGLGNKRHSVELLAQSYNIICISETKFNNESRPINLRNFHQIRKDSDNPNHSGGLISFFRKNLNYVRIYFANVCKPIEYIACRIRLNEEEFVLVQVYFNPSYYIDRSSIIRFFDQLRPIKNLILTGDFNAHSQLWGSELINQRDDILESILTSGYWHICNDGSFTRINRESDKISAPDITIVSPDLQPRVIWGKEEDSLGSDHMPLKIEVLMPNFTRTNVQSKINVAKINWPDFNEQIDRFISSTDVQCNRNNFLESYDKFIDKVNLVAKSYSKPHHKTKADPIPCIWWNDECAQALNDRKSAFKTYLQAPTKENWLHYQFVERTARRVFQKNKKASFRKFCNSLTPDSNIKKVWQTVKAFKKRFLPGNNLQKNNTSPVDNLVVKNSFSELGIINDYGELTYLNEPEPEADSLSKFLAKKISIKEVQRAIDNSKLGKAPGVDGLPYDILKQFSCVTVKWITEFYNFVLDEGRTPKSWSTYLVHMLEKPNSEAYRPISVSCALLKILERIVCDRLNWYIESRGLLPNNFFGFRYGRSCHDCFSVLRTDIDISKARKQYMGVIFVDIKGAFNHVNMKKLLHMLVKIKIPKKLLIFIHNIMTERILQGHCMCTSLGTLITNTGCPQGSVLSPLLFNLYIAKLNEAFTQDIKVIGFADDITFYSANSDRQSLLDSLKNNFMSLQEWLIELDLTISLSKTQFLLFPPNYGYVLPFSVNIQLNNHTLYNSASAKYLGIQWDYKLNWSFHVQKLIDKGGKLINLLRAISAHSWGCHPLVLLSIYKGLIRPALEWGNIIYAQADKKLLSKLNTIQNEALRIITGCFRTTPLNILHHLTGINTLENRRHESAVKLLAKKYAIIDSPLIPKLQYLSSLKLRLGKSFANTKVSWYFHAWLKYKQEFQIISRTRKNCSFSIPYGAFYISDFINISKGKEFLNSSDPNRDFQSLIVNSYAGAVHLFTDGSKMAGPVCGYSIIATNDPQMNCMVRINGYSSIFTAEALAIERALLRVLENETYDAVIFSDSLSVLQTLLREGTHSIAHTTLASIRQKIYAAATRGYSLKIFWIPSHIGILGNEAADVAAKKASSRVNIDYDRVMYMDWYNNFKINMSAKQYEALCNYGGGQIPLKAIII